MKYIILCLSLITTGLAYSQTPVKIYQTGGSIQDRSGDPLPTVIDKLNNNDFLINLRGTASGTDTYTVTLSPPSPGYFTGIDAITAYSSEYRYVITFTNANTGAATLNINSIGAKSIVKQGSVALAAGDIKAGQVMELHYDGTNLQIIGDGGSLAGSAAWGSITGTISSQSDLNTALAAKEDLLTFTASDFNESGQTISLDYTNGQAATSGQKGFLTAADWTTFNGKQAAISLTTTGTSGAATFSSNTVNVPRYDTYADTGDALKIDKLITANRQTSSYTLVLGDALKLVEINNASANNLTVPPNSSVAFSIGTQIMIAQYGAGQTTIVAGSGVTLRSDSGKLKIAAQYGGATLIKIAADEWYVFGNLTD
jgi:hypothetical protein